MKTLVIIPARGGSKGIPHKNIKPLAGRPLIAYAIDCARAVAPDEDICLSTDDPEIIRVAEQLGLKVPFVRPDSLSTDTVGTYEVLLHALDFYENQGRRYNRILLLQPTSPFRLPEDCEACLKLYTPETDMVVSVKETAANPYYNCFEETAEGYLRLSKGNGQYSRRQDAPKAWEYNGAVYVINPESLRQSRLSEFKRVVKYEMPQMRSLDLDTMFDWKMAELLINEKMV